MALRDILDAIAADAQAQADAILCAARQEREDVLAYARSQAADRRAEIIREAEMDAGYERARMLNRVQLDNVRLLVSVQETTFRAAVRQAETRLAQVRQKPGYGNVLSALLQEALAGFTGPVRMDFLSDDGMLVSQWLAKVGRQGDTLCPGLESCGGVIVTSSDGRIVVDNTLERRMERAAPDLRPLLADLLTPTDSGETPSAP